MKHLLAEITVSNNSTPSSATFRGESFRVMTAVRAQRLVNSLKRKYPYYRQELDSHTYFQFHAENEMATVDWSYEACAERAAAASDDQLVTRIATLGANYHYLTQDEWRMWRALCDEQHRRRQAA